MAEQTLIINGDVTLNEGRVLEDALIKGRVWMGPHTTLRNCVVRSSDGALSRSEILTALRVQGRRVRLESTFFGCTFSGHRA